MRTIPCRWSSSSTSFWVSSLIRDACSMQSIPASTAGTLGLAEPLVAVVLAVLVLGERLAPLAIVGGLLLLAGVALASLPPLRRRAPAALAETPS